MKTAKRVLAILMAMLMAVSVFTVAASAAVSLQSKINSAAAGDVISISRTTKESVTIDKNLTIDLGGQILKSAENLPAITVKNGATVTIRNGYIESFFKSYSGATMQTLRILKDVGKAPAGIVAYGANTKVILTDVRVMGGLIRIPKTTEWFFPVGSAVKIYGGATTELNNAVLFGSYAVSNDPANTGRADGKVIVNDAILVGYIDYVKRVYNGLVYDQATVEKVNAADRIIGVLNSNITLEENELSLLKKVMDDRAYIFTTKPTDDKAIVTIDNTGSEPQATITAEPIKDFVNTDCSYKYVPKNAYVVETGKVLPLDTAMPASEVLGKEIRINYRLDFQLKGDFKLVADKILAGKFDELFNKYYGKAVAKADAAFTQLLNTYESKIKEFADIYDAVDTAGKEEEVVINGVHYNAANMLGDDFYAIERGILSVGGVTMYNKTDACKNAGEPFSTIKFSKDSPLYNYGAAAPTDYEVDESTAEDSILSDFTPITVYNVTVLGTLDKIEALKNELLAIKNNASLGDQSKWVAYAHFVLDNYQTVLDICKEADTKLTALYTTLTTGNIGNIVTALKMQDKLNMLKSIVDGVSEANTYIDKALANSNVKKAKAMVDRHANDGTIETYMAKVKRAINDPRQYVTPENLVDADNDGTLLLTYYVNGPTKVETIEKDKLNIKVHGSGEVAFTSDLAGANGTTSSINFKGIAYNKAVTLTATAGEGQEFLYYVIADTQRIYSTNPVCVVDTQAESYIEAVFESTGIAKVIFTNNSGVIMADDVPYSASISTASVEDPGLSGYQLVGWGPNGNTTLTAADFTSAYKSGNSAFENGAVYTVKGFGFKLNSTTANKYLVTPKLESKDILSVYFNDEANPDERWGGDDVPFGMVITYTAQGDNFSYWVDEEGTIVSVYKTYAVEALKDIELTAVYGAEDTPDAVINIPYSVYEDTRAVAYSERSVAESREVVSTGFVVSFVDAVSTEDTLTVDAVDRVNVFKTTSTMKTRQGVSSVGMTYNTMKKDGHDYVAHCRAFVELRTATGSEFIYSNIETFEAS